jgi:hypothetical protein
MPERLPLVDVGDVHLDHGQFHGTDRIPDRDGIMSIGAGVDHDAVHSPQAPVDIVDQRSLRIRLEKVELDTQLFRFVQDTPVDLL